MDYPFIILYILVITILIFSGIAAFGGELLIDPYEDDVYSWDIICERINLEPYYDCPEYIDGYFDATGEAWVVVVVNSTTFLDIEGKTVFGYAVYNTNLNYNINKWEYSVCVNFPKTNTTMFGVDVCRLSYIIVGTNQGPSCYSPYACMSVLEHEIKHQVCKCNWHDGLERERYIIWIKPQFE